MKVQAWHHNWWKQSRKCLVHPQGILSKGWRSQGEMGVRVFWVVSRGRVIAHVRPIHCSNQQWMGIISIRLNHCDDNSAARNKPWRRFLSTSVHLLEVVRELSLHSYKQGFGHGQGDQRLHYSAGTSSQTNCSTIRTFPLPVELHAHLWADRPAVPNSTSLFYLP